MTTVAVVCDRACVYVCVCMCGVCLVVLGQVTYHTELAWILGTITSTGQLSAMTQWKVKKEARDVPCLGLFSYPVLMAADILLYRGTHVPVGHDQTQHLELARTIAGSFNHSFGEYVSARISCPPPRPLPPAPQQQVCVCVVVVVGTPLCFSRRVLFCLRVPQEREPPTPREGPLPAAVVYPSDMPLPPTPTPFPPRPLTRVVGWLLMRKVFPEAVAHVR